MNKDWAVVYQLVEILI